MHLGLVENKKRTASLSQIISRGLGGTKFSLKRLRTQRRPSPSANVILLDEPTDGLDVNALRALEEFAGTNVVVSHDRWFLDRICTHLIVFEGDSIAKMYVGNWSDYEAFMMEKFGKDLTPHRVKYRTLKR